MDSTSSGWVIWIFLPVFIGFWTAIGCVLSAFAGWYGLADRFPDRREPTFLKIGSQSGAMGSGPLGLKVNMSGILTFSACPSGLRVAIWRIFGPFCRPFVVPWREIQARRQKGPILIGTVLTFGEPAAGVLVVSSRTWDRLVKSAREHDIRIEPLVHLSIRRLAIAISLQWALVAAFLSLFFLFVIRQNGPKAAQMSEPGTFLFISAMLTISQVVRFLRELSPP